MNRLSLYIHIPFCARKCRYCDFYSVKYDRAVAASYLSALEREIGLSRQCGIFDDADEIRTVFFGGGTPSVLAPDELRRLCALVRDSFPIIASCEWTVECNPESFTDEKASILCESGVTRLSFGFQSLHDQELRLLGRIHSVDRCLRLLHDPALTKFSSIGIDLMYGLPGQTIASLEETLSMITGAPVVNHISAYELTIAEGTPFGRHRAFLPLPSDDAMDLLTERLWRLLGDAGFEQYEVSNFAKQGHACRHNETYWDHQPYLGLGCAAHSYLHGQRFANVRDIGRYGAILAEGRLPREFVETLDQRRLATEMVFLGLRRTKGIDERSFLEKCGIPFDKFAKREKIEEFVAQGFLRHQKSFLKPTPQGMLRADAIAAAIL